MSKKIAKGICLKCNTDVRYANGRCATCTRKTARDYHTAHKAECHRKAREWKAANRAKSRVHSRKGGRMDWAPGEHEKAEALYPYITHCQCCGSVDPRHQRGWCADHNHKTGMFRGFICHPCNLAIAHVEKFGLDRGQQIALFLAGGRFPYAD